MALTMTKLAQLGCLISYAEKAFMTGNITPPYIVLLDYKHQATIMGERQRMYGWVLTDSANNAYVVLRGTEAAEEWLQDAEFLMQEDPNGQGCVEVGFYSVYSSLNVNGYSLADYLKRQGYASVTVLGHSLGGACASYLASDICDTVTTTLCTYAAPRVGDKEYVNNMQRISARYCVVNANDVVPKLPLDKMEFRSQPNPIRLHPEDLEKLTPARYLNDDVLSNHLVENYVGMLDIGVFDQAGFGYQYNPACISVSKPSLIISLISEVTTRILNKILSWL